MHLFKISIIILFSTRSNELRSLILECIELLLNNLLINSKAGTKGCYNLKMNESFIKFAWQEFCPSILLQFGDCGPTKPSSMEAIEFKQIYTILIQLTGLIGGCSSMISVFEAIYKRILLYLPEQDYQALLKLFKMVILFKLIYNQTLLLVPVLNEFLT